MPFSDHTSRIAIFHRCQISSISLFQLQDKNFYEFVNTNFESALLRDIRWEWNSNFMSTTYPQSKAYERLQTFSWGTSRYESNLEHCMRTYEFGVCGMHLNHLGFSQLSNENTALLITIAILDLCDPDTLVQLSDLLKVYMSKDFRFLKFFILIARQYNHGCKQVKYRIWIIFLRMDLVGLTESVKFSLCD